MNFKPNKMNLFSAVLGLVIGAWLSQLLMGCPPDPVACQQAQTFSLLLFGGGLAIVGYLIGSAITKGK